MSTSIRRPVVVVTGATGGIGSAIVASLVDAGCDVIAVVRDAARAAALRDLLPAEALWEATAALPAVAALGKS